MTLRLLMIVWLLPFAFAAQTRSSDADKKGSTYDAVVGKLAVVNKTDNTISIIDLSSQKIINTLPTGTGPHELVLSPDEHWAVSTDFVGGDSLTVFDVQAQIVVRTIALPDLPGPHGIRFLQDNTHVLFTSGASQSLGIANIQNGKVTETIETAQNTTHMIALSGDEKTAYTTNIRSDSISVIDLVSGKKVKDIATEAMPEAINYRVGSEELWYGANQEGVLLVINPETEKVLARWDGFSFPYRVIFNHSRSIAMVPDFRRHNVRFFDAENKQEIGLLALEPEAGPQGIILHPTEDVVFLSLNLKNKVLAIDIATQTVVGEYPTGNNPDGIIFINDKAQFDGK